MLKNWIGYRRNEESEESPDTVAVTAATWADAQRRMAQAWNRKHDDEPVTARPSEFELLNVKLPGGKP